MRNSFWAAALFATVALVGCGYDNPKTGSEVDVSGTVTGPDGKALTGVSITFQPAEAGARPSSFPLKADGTFSGKMIVGKYLYSVSAGEGDRKGEAIVSKLPDNYKKVDENRKVEVTSSGGVLKLTF